MNTVVRLFVAVTVSILLIPLVLSAAELSKGEKDTIFIAPLKVQPAVAEMARKKNRLAELKQVSGSLETQLISTLIGTRVFQLVEQGAQAKPEFEPDAAADNADRDDTDAAQVAEKAGAKFAFIPMIDAFEDRSETVEYQATGRASLSRKLFLSAVVQIVDTESGELLPDSPSVQLTRGEEIENARIGQLAGSEEIIVALAREMAMKLSQEVVMLLRPAKVLAVTGKQVLINRGSDAGFAKGDLVEFYSVQAVKDDDTGEMFSNEVPVGQAVIKRIEKFQSYAAITGDDKGITKGCVARFLKTAANRAAEGAPPPDATLPDFGTKNDMGTTPGSSEKPLKWK